MSATPRNISFVKHDAGEADQRPLDLSLIRRLFTFTKPYAALRNTLLFLVILRAAFLPAVAWAIGAILGGPISRLDTRGILLGALGYAVLTLVVQVSLKYRSMLALYLGEKVVRDLRQDMFEHLQQMTMRFFNKVKLGRTISRFTSDAESMRVGIQDVLFVSMVNGGQMLGAALVMLWFDRVLFLIVVGIAPVLWALNRYFRARLSRAFRAVQESFSRITTTMAESVKGIRVTQGFGRQDMNSGIFADLVADHARYNMTVAKGHGALIPLLEVNSQLFIALIILVGGWRVFTGRTEMEHLYQFIMMAAVFFRPIQVLGNQYNNALSAMAGAERVYGFLDTKPDWSDPVDSVKITSLKGQIEFRNVTFAYDPEKPVLRDISFSIEQGKTVALAGHTGSGKTTIINLVSKFYPPTSGELLIDGMDIGRINTRSLHEHMGIVLQQNFLFTGTVSDNIRMGRPSATREEIVEAVRKLDCLDMMESLPDGLNTVVGEGGSGISLGQRQLICFARAMLANPGILILDEATSSVDSITEARIQKALAILLKGRTSLVVAHRLSTIRHADLVLVLDKGCLVEQGNHTKLLRRKGHYASLYRRFVS